MIKKQRQVKHLSILLLRLHFNRDSVLATISRSLRDKLTSNQAAIVQENENLEEDMRKAQESTLMLKSVIIPLETEINQLKMQLKEATTKIVELEALVCVLTGYLSSTNNFVYDSQ
jgi:septal ring factor EnvC (AmiA/AmiB activator)